MLATQYMDTVLDRLSRITAGLDTIGEIGEFIAQAVKNGKKVYIMDRYGIVDAELVERPSGLMLFRPFKNEGNAMTSGDIFLLSSFYPDNESDLALVTQAHSRGAVVVTISPEGSLSRAADRALTNESCGENSVISVSGIETRFCPVNGIINATLAWALAAEITESLLNRQMIPSVFTGEYLADKTGKNIEARKKYLSNGY